MSMQRTQHNDILMEEKEIVNFYLFLFFWFLFGGVCHKKVLNNLVRAVIKVFYFFNNICMYIVL